MPRIPAGINGIDHGAKAVGDVLSYVFDWKPRANATDSNGTDWLGPNEAIASYTITVPAGITVDSHTKTNVTVHAGAGVNIPLADNTAVQVVLSGGTAGETYKIECEIVTDSIPALTKTKYINLPVE